MTMLKRLHVFRVRPRRGGLGVVLAVMLMVVVPAIALGHAVVYPSTSAPGAYERYVLRVPNEKGVATTRIEIRFPADARVVSFADVSGWRLEVLTDSAQRVIGAVWTGQLPPQRFVELPFVAVNPAGDTRLVWPTYQTYADGERVEWTGAPESDRPASSTRITAANATATTPQTAASSANSGWVGWAAIAALVISLISLGLAMRSRPTA